MRPTLGQIVEFETNHPHAVGRTLRGRVTDVGTARNPRNPVVTTSVGDIELLASAWGSRVRVVHAA